MLVGVSKHIFSEVKSGKLNSKDYVAVFDGNDPLTNTMLAQLSGNLTEENFTSTTTKVNCH